MKKKGIIISSVLALIFIITFFIGGNNKIIPLSSEQMNNDVVESQRTLTARDEKGLEDSTDKEIDEDPEEEAEKEKESEEKESEELAAEKTKEETPKKPNEPKSNPQVNTEQKVKEQKAEKAEIIKKDNANKGNKDKYQTDPVPAGKPQPVEWQEVAVKEDKPLTANLSVTSKTILNNMNMFNKNKLEVLPSDGVIYPTQTVQFSEGESVFDVLLREMKKNKIHMEFTMTPIYNSHYIEGINNIYEFDCGELSGWMYKVNGWFPNYGASRYQLKDGDVIEWVYTCDLGRDIGGESGIVGGD